MINQRKLLRCFVSVTFCALLLTGCATRPLVLNPRIKPMDFVVEQPYDKLVLIPFEDKAPAAERGTKQFQEQPIDVFNDTLLTALRNSQIFKSVARGAETKAARYQLNGAVTTFATDDSTIMSALLGSMKVSALCVSNIRFVDLSTGAVLLEESVRSTGVGGARVTAAGQYAQSDITYGYEESISQAIGENVAIITRRLHEVLSKKK